jgi:hypothetical protein
VFNQAGQCVGIAFQSLSGGDAENIGWVHCAAFATYFAFVRHSTVVLRLGSLRPDTG